MANLSLAVASLLALNGCSRSSEDANANTQAQKDKAPTEIRGERIAPAAPVPSQAQTAQPSPQTPAENTATVAATPITPTAATNSVQQANTAAVPAAAPAAAANEAVEPGFVSVTFDKLASFNFEVTDEQVTSTNQVAGAKKSDEQIPAEVKALNEKQVALKGFMLPLKVESGLVTEMLIMRDQSMCCYGTVPKINEWVSVKMTKKGVKAVMDQPVTVYGTLKVGEMRENGYLVGIYQMEGQKIAEPLDM